ncbi:MAG TPA: TonB-dependent receptor plug domain-containing protein [Opitutaceae bacterium]|nr:TonB-dependent receptor plug domain-containing protein [Opitutaceae bacterium]
MARNDVTQRFAWIVVLILALAVTERAYPAAAETIEFNLPAQPADRALLAFSKQAKVEILFSYDDLRRVRSHDVIGRFEPQEALDLLLKDSGFTARRNGPSKWIVMPTAPPPASIKGRILAPDGSAARRVRVTLVPAGTSVLTGDSGEFHFDALAPGQYRVVVAGPNYHPLQIVNVLVKAGHVTSLAPQILQRIEDPTRLEPFVVEGQTNGHVLDHSDALFAPRTAGGNLDLPRTESDPLPYMIFNRTQIARSGVVNLNEFLQRELIDASASTLPPEQDPNADSFLVGSNNLGLRGYSDEETVILVNGRPLPEVLISGQNSVRPPDVNFIPLSLVQQVEVLPVSAASLYSGNAVGGVINIVLRPDVDTNATEVTATYTNALAGYDAPQASLSLLHTESLLKGALRVRLNANYTRAIPPTEAELGYLQRRAIASPNADTSVYRATPNIRSVWPPVLPIDPGAILDGTNPGPGSTPGIAPTLTPLPGLFGPGTPPVTSVAPGADGTGGLAAFAGREGRRNFAFFDSPGGMAASVNSVDYPYGRKQERTTYYGSAVYDAFPWLQLAVDGTYSRTMVHRGYDVFPVDLMLKSTSPFNPFRQDVIVSLNETAPRLGEGYDEARLDFGSVVLSALLKLPADWKLTLDAQYAHNIARYRGLAQLDTQRLQTLVDEGVYNPLRDTQVFGPPQAFYDQALVYRGGPGRFVTLGNYETLDLALRATNENVKLPTGQATFNFGADDRRDHLARFTDVQRYADGTLFQEPSRWDGRTLNRYSGFGELQAPLYPAKRLPHWLTRAETDLALRYVAANSAKEAYFAPTYGMKLGFPGGFSVRGSITTSNRYPTPQMSRPLILPSGDTGPGSPNYQPIFDPLRKQNYEAIVNEVINPDLRPEAAVTQTAGLIFERGREHRFRAAIDFVDTHKVNEIVFLDANRTLALEALWPERVVRAPARPGDPAGAGLVQSITTMRANLASRDSRDWTGSFDYRWSGCRGGTLEAYARVLYFQSYIVQPLPNTPTVDELNAPDGLVPLLRYRANFGTSWSNRNYAFGVDGHYFHSQILPESEWQTQGHDRIRPYWQFDAFVQTNVGRWLPWKSDRYGLRVQARVNNVLGDPFPKYANDPSGAGVQPYGDWRGRVYSLSLTATF